MKTQALRDSLSQYPDEAIDSFIEYHKINGGLSRFKKFKYFFEEILCLEDYQEKYQEALQTFSSISMSRLQRAPLMPGIQTILSALHERGLPTIIASGAAQDDLQLIIQALQMDKFFQYIGGSPDSKTQIVNKFLQQMPHTNVRGLFFGDALSDYEAAKKLNFTFIFISGDSEWAESEVFLSSKRATIIENFYDIEIR